MTKRRSGRGWILLEQAGPLGTHKDRRREMKNVVLLSVLMVFGVALFSGRASMAGETAGEYIDDSMIHTKVTEIVVKDPDAHYFEIDVTVTRGDVVITGFVNSRKTEERLIGKIREIRGVKSVKSLLKMEERNQN
jgi:osmotically-inducible protein OsmY